MSGLDYFLDPPAWHRDAACRGPDIDVNDFYPGQGESMVYVKALCQVCPVRPQCRDAGIRERYGVWGGLSERERRRLRHQLGLTAIGDEPQNEPQPEPEYESEGAA